MDLVKGASELINLAESGASRGELSDAYNEMLGRSYSILAFSRTFKTHETFWRVRRLPISAVRDPLEKFSHISAAWAPRPEYRPGAGRVNLEGEGLLYTCVSDSSPCFAEARAETSPFALIKYRAARPIQAAAITDGSGVPAHAPHYSSSVSDREKLKFLHELFSVSGDRAGAYVLSELIARDLFDYPGQDAWSYGSIRYPGAVNVAFRNDSSRDALVIDSVILGYQNIFGIRKVEYIGKPGRHSFKWLEVGGRALDDVL